MRVQSTFGGEHPWLGHCFEVHPCKLCIEGVAFGWLGLCGVKRVGRAVSAGKLAGGGGGWGLND